MLIFLLSIIIWILIEQKNDDILFSLIKKQ